MTTIINPDERIGFVIDSESYSDKSEYDSDFNEDFNDQHENQFKSGINAQPTRESKYSKRYTSNKCPFTIFLDLDNTLIHAEINIENPYDFTVIAEDEPNKKVTVYITKRPHLNEFLSSVSSFAQIFLYTAAEKSYAEQVLSYLDPSGEYFSGCFYRDSCKFNFSNNSYIKDISIAGSNPARTILVDDSLDSFGGKLENAIHISPFLGESCDRELETLELVLESLKSYDDIRPILKYINCPN